MSYRVTQEQCIQDKTQLDDENALKAKMDSARAKLAQQAAGSGRSAAGRFSASSARAQAPPRSMASLRNAAKAAPAEPKPKPPALGRSESLEARGLVPLKEACATITEHFVEDRTSEMGGAGNPFDVLGEVCPLDVELGDPGWKVVGGRWEEITL